MGAIAPLEGDNRIAKADTIRQTSESVYEVIRQIDEANEELDDLNEGLRMLADKHGLYKIKAAKARKMMRQLSSEL